MALNPNNPRGPYTNARERVWPTSVEFIRLYEDEGLGLRDIAERYGIPYSSFMYYVKRQGWKTRSVAEGKRKARALLTKANLVKWYTEEKQHTQAIAVRCGVSRDTVVRQLNRLGLPIRHCAYVTWSHKLVIDRLRRDGFEVSGDQVNHRVVPTRYKVDIGFPETKLAIEIDGRSHFEESDGYYGPRREYDRKRDAELHALGWDVLHFTDHDVRYRLGWVLSSIEGKLARVESRTSAGHLSRPAEMVI